MLTVISPAKKLNECAPATRGCTTPVFIEQAGRLNKKLRRMNADDLQELQHISSKLAELNVERNKSWKAPFTEENAQPAIHTFNGEVYVRLDAGSMDSNDLKFAQKNLRILSGLYGILKPLDLMQPYRLEMGTPLKVNGSGDLYEFWGDQITREINTALEEQPQKDRALINLASNEYFKAIDPDHVQAPVITPVFKERKGDKYKVVAILAKRARGLMSRYIIDERIRQPEGLKSFSLDGYGYNPDLSSETEWVFTRDNS